MHGRPKIRAPPPRAREAYGCPRFQRQDGKSAVKIVTAEDVVRVSACVCAPPRPACTRSCAKFSSVLHTSLSGPPGLGVVSEGPRRRDRGFILSDCSLSPDWLSPNEISATLHLKRAEVKKTSARAGGTGLRRTEGLSGAARSLSAAASLVLTASRSFLVDREPVQPLQAEQETHAQARFPCFLRFICFRPGTNVPPPPPPITPQQVDGGRGAAEVQSHPHHSGPRPEFSRFKGRNRGTGERLESDGSCPHADLSNARNVRTTVTMSDSPHSGDHPH